MPEIADLQLNFFTEIEESEKERMATHSKIEELVNVFKRPIIAMPGYADLPVPNDLRNVITIERLIMVREAEKLASEAECMWYLSTASLTFPLSHEWANIYQWLTRRYLIKTHRTLPTFLENEITLEKHMEKDQLLRLRRWLYKKSVEAMKERRRYAEAKT